MTNTKKKTWFRPEIIIPILLIVSFLVWLLLFLLERGHGLQSDIFFQRLNDFLADATNVTGYTSADDPYFNTDYQGLEEKAYPPLTYVFMYLMSRVVNIVPYREVQFFLPIYYNPAWMMLYLFGTVVTALFVYEIIRTAVVGSENQKRLTAVAMMLTFGMLFTMERGNTLILTIGFVCLYLFWYDSESALKREVAIMSLGVAAAFKLSPALLGLLLIYDRRWLQAVRCALYGVFFIFAPFAAIEGGFANIPQWISNIRANVDSYKDVKSGVSLQNTVFYIRQFLTGSADNNQALYSVCRIVAIVLALVILAGGFFVCFKWEQVLMVSAVVTFYPAHSGKYNILYLLPAFIMLLNAYASRNAGEKDEVPLRNWENIILLVAFFLLNQDVQLPEKYMWFTYICMVPLIALLCAVKAIRAGVVFAVNRKSVPEESMTEETRPLVNAYAGHVDAARQAVDNRYAEALRHVEVTSQSVKERAELQHRAEEEAKRILGSEGQQQIDAERERHEQELERLNAQRKAHEEEMRRIKEEEELVRQMREESKN